MHNTPLLHFERPADLEPDSIKARLAIVSQLRNLPPEAFTHLKHLQPQTGCFNRCSFCSQSAGKDVWQFTRQGQRNFLAALKSTAREVTSSETAAIGSGRTTHRPGVIFPYLDNDIGSYPYLDDFIDILWNDFGSRVRIASVGYSALNDQLQDMHERISRELPHAFAGVRFSFTPYTIAWTSRSNDNKQLARDQLISDFANALSTYRPVFDYLGIGKETACVEIRFRPLAVTFTGPLVDEFLNGHHVVKVGPHLLVRREQGRSELPLSHISSVQGGVPVITGEPATYFLATSDARIEQGDWRQLAEDLIQGRLDAAVAVRTVSVYLFSNADGPYYAVDPLFRTDGVFEALHIYALTTTRIRSGYTDATRYFLNALLKRKAEHGLGRREPFLHASDYDVELVIDQLRCDAEWLSRHDVRASRHIREEIVPIIEAYARALSMAGMPASYFFDRRFTVDTGQIVNQGRALSEFNGLVSHHDEPVTPQEERGFGDVSVSSERGNVWRIAPAPHQLRGRPLLTSSIGRKNSAANVAALQVQELDSRYLRPLREYLIEGVDLEHISLAEANTLKAYPGLTTCQQR